MGRQSRIKRERRHARVLTIPLPGFEGKADEHGHFDDCPICQALRAGDEATANELIRTHPDRVDGSTVHELDPAPFVAWLAANGIDLEAPY